MSNYDEFDLDLRMETCGGSEDGASPAGLTGKICYDLSTDAASSLLGGCTNGGICDYTETCPNTSYCTATESTCTCYC